MCGVDARSKTPRRALWRSWRPIPGRTDYAGKRRRRRDQVERVSRLGRRSKPQDGYEEAATPDIARSIRGPAGHGRDSYKEEAPRSGRAAHRRGGIDVISSADVERHDSPEKGGGRRDERNRKRQNRRRHIGKVGCDCRAGREAHVAIAGARAGAAPAGEARPGVGGRREGHRRPAIVGGRAGRSAVDAGGARSYGATGPPPVAGGGGGTVHTATA